MIGSQMQTKYSVSKHRASGVKGDGVTGVADACEALWIFSAYSNAFKWHTAIKSQRSENVRLGTLASGATFPRRPLQWLSSACGCRLMGHSVGLALASHRFGTRRRRAVSFELRLPFPSGKIFKSAYPLNRRLDGSQDHPGLGQTEYRGICRKTSSGSQSMQIGIPRRKSTKYWLR